MRLVLVTIVLTSASLWAQSAKDPGHASRYASVGKRYGGGSATVPAAKTEPLASQLAKIEQQGAHVPSSSPGSHPATAAPVFPKTPASQNKNRPMKFTSKSQPTRSGQPH